MTLLQITGVRKGNHTAVFCTMSKRPREQTVPLSSSPFIYPLVSPPYFVYFKTSVAILMMCHIKSPRAYIFKIFLIYFNCLFISLNSSGKLLLATFLVFREFLGGENYLASGDSRVNWRWFLSHLKVNHLESPEGRIGKHSASGMLPYSIKNKNN